MGLSYPSGDAALHVLTLLVWSEGWTPICCRHPISLACHHQRNREKPPSYCCCCCCYRDPSFLSMFGTPRSKELLTVTPTEAARRKMNDERKDKRKRNGGKDHRLTESAARPSASSLSSSEMMQCDATTVIMDRTRGKRTGSNQRTIICKLRRTTSAPIAPGQFPISSSSATTKKEAIWGGRRHEVDTARKSTAEWTS